MRLKVSRFWLATSLAAALAQASLASAQQSPAQQSQYRLTQLHDALHLTADQEAAWRAYTAAVAPDPSSQARHEAAEKMMATLPTPRRVALMDATMSQDIEAFRRQGQAVLAFYGRLRPDQQQIFDRQTAPQSQGGGDDD